MQDHSLDRYSVGDLADRFGVSTQSIRNWEEHGVIPPSPRTPGGHRRYTHEHVEAIRKVMESPVAGQQTNGNA